MVPDPPDSIDLSGGGVGGPWPAIAVTGITGARAAGNTTYDYRHGSSGGAVFYLGREANYEIRLLEAGVWQMLFESEAFFTGAGEWPWLVADWVDTGDGAGTPVLTRTRGLGFKVAAPGAVATVQATAALSAGGYNFNWTAVPAGRLGNDIRIRFLNPGANDAALAVIVDGRDITVSLATGGAGAVTTTAAEIKTALDADPAAAALITTGLAGSGTAAALGWLSFGGGLGGLPLPPDTVTI